MLSNIIRNKKGIILITIYLVIAILLVFNALLVSRSANENSLALRYKDLTLAFNLAEAGLDRGINWLRANPAPLSTVANPWGGVQSLGEGTYSVSLSPDPSNPIIFLDKFRISSTGAVRGISQTLNSDLQTDSFARYTYFTIREHYGQTPVWFIGVDRLGGPTQTNGHFHIKSNPVFEGTVAASDNFITFYNNGRNISTTATSNPPYDVPDFQQGINLGAAPVVLPNMAADLKSAAQNGGLKLTGPTAIVLNADGTMNVTNSDKGWNNQNRPLPANGALFVERGDVTLYGTLNGQLTIGGSRNIIVTNNILYADDPRTNPASDDILGIISEKNVIISRNAPYNLEIDATLMGLDTSFVVENWYYGPVKGTLNVYGGIIQRERGPVGLFNGATGQKISGYSKNYRYDDRLAVLSPPFYPTTGDYVVLSWRN